MRRLASSRTDVPLLRSAGGAVACGIALGILLGPLGCRWLQPSLLDHSGVLESLTEGAVLAGLFCLALRMREPLDWSMWRVPVRLGTVASLATAVLAASAAYTLFDISFPEALLLGAVLAPTDAGLATRLKQAPESERDGLPFMLAAEGGLGSALTIGLIVTALEPGPWSTGGRALAIAGALLGGALLGWICGAAVARVLRRLECGRAGDPLEMLMVFATAPLVYLCAVAVHAAAAVAVLAAGLALAHAGQLKPTLRNPAVGRGTARWAAQLEHGLALMTAVLIGALLGTVELGVRAVLLALLLLLLRPLAVRLALIGIELPSGYHRQLDLLGVRGLATLYGATIALERAPAPLRGELAAAAVLCIAGCLLCGALGVRRQRRTAAGTLDL